MAGFYTLSIRSIRSSEYTLNIPRAATVGALKSRLMETYPGSPAPDQQRLVFAGRLLTDANESLEKVFAGWDDSIPLPVHLVVRSSAAPSPTSPTSAPAVAPVAQPMGWQQYPGNVRFAQQPPMRAQAPQQQAGAGQPQQQAARGHSLSLVIKLAFFVFILSQGSSYQRKLFFGAVALVLYLYHIGWIRFQAQIHVFQAQRPQAPNNDPAAAAAPAAPSPEALLAAFVFSLLPTWQPPTVPAPPPPEAAAAA